MRINAIQNIINLKHTPVTKGRINLPAMQNDTFTKTTSFKSSQNDDSFSAFKKWAEETDFLSNAKNITDKTGKKLGSGFEGTVIEIPGNDKWVIKVLKRSNLIQQKTDRPAIYEIKDKLPDLNVGQMIAYVKIPVNENLTSLFYILRRQKGESYGLDVNLTNSLNETNIKTYISSLKKLSEYPYSSYKQMVRDIIKANEKGLIFDCYNPNNIMLDDENKRINFVDVEFSGRESVPFQFLGLEILHAMLDSNFGALFTETDYDKDKKAEAKKYSDIITEKYQRAVKEEMEEYSKKHKPFML